MEIGFGKIWKSPIYVLNYVPHIKVSTAKSEISNPPDINIKPIEKLYKVYKFYNKQLSGLSTISSYVDTTKYVPALTRCIYGRRIFIRKYIQ